MLCFSQKFFGYLLRLLLVFVYLQACLAEYRLLETYVCDSVKGCRLNGLPMTKSIGGYLESHRMLLSSPLDVGTCAMLEGPAIKAWRAYAVITNDSTGEKITVPIKKEPIYTVSPNGYQIIALNSSVLLYDEEDGWDFRCVNTSVDVFVYYEADSEAMKGREVSVETLVSSKCSTCCNEGCQTTLPTVQPTRPVVTLPPTQEPNIKDNSFPTQEPNIKDTSVPTQEPNIKDTSVPTAKPNITNGTSPTQEPNPTSPNEKELNSFSGSFIAVAIAGGAVVLAAVLVGLGYAFKRNKSSESGEEGLSRDESENDLDKNEYQNVNEDMFS